MPTSSAEFLEECAARFEGQLRRLEAVAQRTTDGRWAEKRPPSGWSAGQILNHLIKANGPYLERLREASPRIPGGPRTEPVRYSWFGRTLARVAGPQGNAPAPGFLAPDPEGPPRGVPADLRAQLTTLARVAREFARQGASVPALRNPFFGMIPMTLDDYFLVLVEHHERHVQQVERR